MINHACILTAGFTGKKRLATFIKKKQLTLAGNQQLKIYGLLTCASGKRMKAINRVFFIDEQEAVEHGYRPCAHCMHRAWLLWRGKLNKI